MKIMQLCSASDIGGGERHMADLANGLAERGHEVFVVLRRNSQIELTLSSIPAGNIKYVAMRNALDFPSAASIAKLADRVNTDIIHAHLARDYPLAALASRISGVPFVLTRHTLFPLKRVARLLLQNARGILATSNAVERSLREQCVFPAERIHRITLGIDTAKFRAGQPIVHSDFSVGTIGHISPIKGHDVFVHAAKLVLDERPDIRFAILGSDKSREGRNWSELVNLIAKLGLRTSVRLDGWVEDVRPFLAGIDVFVSAARSEPFGLAIAEAMMSGKPVIASESEGAVEMIEDGVSGILVPREDPRALAAAILDLAQNDSLRELLARNAVERVTLHFSLERMITQTIEFYDSVLTSYEDSEQPVARQRKSP